MGSHWTCQSGGSEGERNVVGALKWWKSRTHPLQYFNYFLICFLLFYYILTPFHSVWLPPVSCKATFSCLFASVLQYKTPKTVPEVPVPSWPASPSLDYCSPPLMKKPWCLRLISPGWISDSSLLFFSFFVSFFFFLSVSVSGWWGEWSWSGGWGDGGGWGEASSWAGMTRLVGCMCVATVAQRSCSFHIFRWLLHIIHSSQLLFQALWVAELSTRPWIGVIKQRFPTFWGLVTPYNEGLSTGNPLIVSSVHQRVNFYSGHLW